MGLSPLVSRADFIRIDVHARDVNAKLGKACSGYESNISRANYRDMHLWFIGK